MVVDLKTTTVEEWL